MTLLLAHHEAGAALYGALPALAALAWAWLSARWALRRSGDPAREETR